MQMDGAKKYCFACMEELTSCDQLICPKCGHDNHFRTNGAGMLDNHFL